MKETELPPAYLNDENVEAGEEELAYYKTDLGLFTELNPDALPSEELEREWFLTATKKGPIIGALFLFSLGLFNTTVNCFTD